MSPLKSLREQTSRVILNRGDIIIDLVTGFAGTLLTRERHIDPIDDDVFLWEVQWLYWVGPIIGGIIGAVIMHYIYTKPAEKEA